MDNPKDASRPGARISVNLGSLDDALAYQIRMAQAASFRGFQRKVGLKWLKPGWFAVLSLIKDNPGVTAAELSRASGRDKSTMTPLLRELEQRALIVRTGVPEDRRRHALELTEEGASALDRLRSHAKDHDRELDSIAGSNKQVVLEVLRQVAATYEE